MQGIKYKGIKYKDIKVGIIKSKCVFVTFVHHPDKWQWFLTSVQDQEAIGPLECKKSNYLKIITEYKYLHLQITGIFSLLSM